MPGLAVYDFTGPQFKVKFTPSTNALVSDNGFSCDLSVLGTSDCTFDFKLEVRSFNGTISEIANA